MILVFCSNKKLGLHGEVKVLVSRLNKSGYRAKMVYYEESHKFRPYDTLILYHLNYLALKVIISARLMRVKTLINVEHEPTSYKEKRFNNTFGYSIVVYLIQSLLRFLSNITVSPSLDLGKGRHTYVNLNYELNTFERKRKCENYLYLGRQDSTRGYYKLVRDPKVKFFPNCNDLDKSDARKLKYFEGTKAVLNVYDRRITQSGVTADALSKGIPVIVNSNDPLFSESNFGGYLRGVVSLEDYAHVKFDDCDRLLFERDFDKYFGMTAFKNTWIKIIKGL
jgi:hypothetical protein